MRRTIYFPPPFTIPEGTEHGWAVVRWRSGQGIRWTRVVPFGYRMMLCRLGVHVMIRSFLQDAKVCACGRCRVNDEWEV